MTRQEFVRKWGLQPNTQIAPNTPMVDLSNQLIHDLDLLEAESLKHLQHYHDTTVGLFVTDVPEKLAKRLFDLAIRHKDNQHTGLIMLENELTIGPLTWQLESIYKSTDPDQLEVNFEEVKK